MPGDKIRFRYAKTGPLRLLSHHDLMRSAERMLRRAALPFRTTQGFHPTPRLVFALPCPLGVEAHNDVVELELTAPHEADDVLARLNAVAPDGLLFTAAREVPLKSTAVPRRAVYTLATPPDRAAEIQDRAQELLAAEKVWVERTVPTPRRLNIRPFIRNLDVTATTTTADLWVTGTGTARGDELVRLLGLTHLVKSGAVLARTDLEIHDELPAGSAVDGPPIGPPEIERLAHTVGTAPTEDTPTATWGLSPTGPAVE